jgi:FkbM family methyltransferase
MDFVINESVKPLITECELIEQAESFFAEDDLSREQYRRELVFMGLHGILGDSNILTKYAGNMPPKVWEDAVERVAALRASGHLPEIAYPVFEDQAIPSMYASIFVIEQYACEDFARPREGDVFLDCGAFCGETAIWALYRGAGHVYAFEPNPEAAPYLVANVARFGRGRITRVPLAVGASSTRGGFKVKGENGDMSGACLTNAAEGVDTVPVVTIDDWCQENSIRPDFIKMDIEGAEPEAINGASHVIGAYRPSLAICLYHRLSDMWVIPHMLKKLVPEYRFRCRKNAPNAEFVLYATV